MGVRSGVLRKRKGTISVGLLVSTKTFQSFHKGMFLDFLNELSPVQPERKNRQARNDDLLTTLDNNFARPFPENSKFSVLLGRHTYTKQVAIELGSREKTTKHPARTARTRRKKRSSVALKTAVEHKQRSPSAWFHPFPLRFSSSSSSWKKKTRRMRERCLPTASTLRTKGRKPEANGEPETEHLRRLFLLRLLILLRIQRVLAKVAQSIVVRHLVIAEREVMRVCCNTVRFLFP